MTPEEATTGVQTKAQGGPYPLAAA